MTSMMTWLEALVVLDGPHLTPDMAEELLRDLIRPDLHQQFQKTN